MGNGKEDVTMITQQHNAYKVEKHSNNNMTPSDLKRLPDDFIFNSPVWLFGVMPGFLFTDSRAEIISTFYFNLT